MNWPNHTIHELHHHQLIIRNRWSLLRDKSISPSSGSPLYQRVIDPTRTAFPTVNLAWAVIPVAWLKLKFN